MIIKETDISVDPRPVKRLANLYQKESPLQRVMTPEILECSAEQCPRLRDSALGALTDPRNEEPVMLYDAHGTGSLWNQIAVMTCGDGLYAILKPRPYGREKESDRDAVVFRVKNFNCDGHLKAECDKAVVTRVFEEYRRLLKQKE